MMPINLMVGYRMLLGLILRDKYSSAKGTASLTKLETKKVKSMANGN
jgi:hypothetical protein